MLLPLYAVFLGLNGFYLLDSLYEGSTGWAALHFIAVLACLGGIVFEVRGNRS